MIRNQSVTVDWSACTLKCRSAATRQRGTKCYDYTFRRLPAKRSIQNTQLPLNSVLLSRLFINFFSPFATLAFFCCLCFMFVNVPGNSYAKTLCRRMAEQWIVSQTPYSCIVCSCLWFVCVFFTRLHGASSAALFALEFWQPMQASDRLHSTTAKSLFFFILLMSLHWASNSTLNNHSKKAALKQNENDESRMSAAHKWLLHCTTNNSLWFQHFVHRCPAEQTLQ